MTSTPEVSGTRQKPGPDASGFSSAIDLRTHLHRSRVPASKRKGCPTLLGKTSATLRSTGLGQLFLPVRAQRPGRSGIRRSVGAAPSRNGERSWADREHARPVPGRMKARHLPKCNGATSKLCIALLALASLRFARLASLALASARIGSPGSPHPRLALPRSPHVLAPPRLASPRSPSPRLAWLASPPRSPFSLAVPAPSPRPPRRLPPAASLPPMCRLQNLGVTQTQLGEPPNQDFGPEGYSQ